MIHYTQPAYTLILYNTLRICLFYRMVKLLKLSDSQTTVDLTVSFAPSRFDQEDIAGPPVEYVIDNL